MYDQKIEIEVEVMGHKINISTHESERDSLVKAVNCLNKKINTIRQQLPLVESNKIVVLASLNLIHEFMKMKDENGLSFESMNNRLDDILAKCDDILKQ